MREDIKGKMKEITFGILLGVYGNIIVGFLDRVELPTIMNNTYYSQYLLILAFILTFILYIIFSYAKSRFSTLIWFVHAIVPMIVFLVQETYAVKSNIHNNIVFIVVLTIFWFAILVGEGVVFGRSTEIQLKNRWRAPYKIGILSDMGWDESNEEIFSWTNISIDEWREEINNRKLNIKIDKIKVSNDFNKYVAIINPYGGVYPESDLKNLSDFKYILSYVNNGGIFTNVADIPTYWAYNHKLKRKIDNTRAIYAIDKDYQVIAHKPFSLTPLVEELGLNMYNTSTNPTPIDLTEYDDTDLKFVSKRICVMESNVTSCIPTYSYGKKKITSLFYCNYGEGTFLISLFWINDDMYREEHKNVFQRAIISNLLNKIEEKRGLLGFSETN